MSARLAAIAAVEQRDAAKQRLYAAAQRRLRLSNEQLGALDGNDDDDKLVARRRERAAAAFAARANNAAPLRRRNKCRCANRRVVVADEQAVDVVKWRRRRDRRRLDNAAAAACAAPQSPQHCRHSAAAATHAAESTAATAAIAAEAEHRSRLVVIRRVDTLADRHAKSSNARFAVARAGARNVQQRFVGRVAVSGGDAWPRANFYVCTCRRALAH